MSSGSIEDAGTSSRQSFVSGGSWPSTTCATPKSLTIQTLAARPPPPAFSHTSFGGVEAGLVHCFGTHRSELTSGGVGELVKAMPSATKPGGGTAAHANAETCFHSCPQTCRNRTGCGNNASITLFRCGDPAIAHALVSVTSNALACLPLWPYDPVAVTGAYRLGSAKPGVAYDPRGTRSRLRAAKLCSNLACQNEAALLEPVASEVQTRVKLECGLTATRIPANTSRDKGTPLVAAAWLTSDPPGAPEPSPRSTEDPFGLTRAPAPTDTE
mmetsp:Transcript_11927/g.51164  ORF Transcript_11927/g.51164 Transcript_11927/m.51164 type:complete len:271 (-) Transcript_11927:1467-2279(-)